VELECTNLTPQQVEAIFAARDTSSHLKVLRIGGNNLSSLHPEVLARVTNKLETVDMKGVRLTKQQMTRILTQSLLTTSSRQTLQVIQELSMYKSDIEVDIVAGETEDEETEDEDSDD